MKHQNPDQIVQSAELLENFGGVRRMTRRERIERWATVLEQHSVALCALRRIEYLAPEELRSYRAANTPLSIAYHDLVLREEGLASDRLGDAMDFFELSDADAHKLLCDCHYVGAMTGKTLARRLRQHIRWTAFRDACAGVVRAAFGR